MQFKYIKTLKTVQYFQWLYEKIQSLEKERFEFICLF